MIVDLINFTDPISPAERDFCISDIYSSDNFVLDHAGRLRKSIDYDYLIEDCNDVFHPLNVTGVIIDEVIRLFSVPYQINKVFLLGPSSDYLSDYIIYYKNLDDEWVDLGVTDVETYNSGDGRNHLFDEVYAKAVKIVSNEVGKKLVRVKIYNKHLMYQLTNGDIDNSLEVLDEEVEYKLNASFLIKDFRVYSQKNVDFFYSTNGADYNKDILENNVLNLGSYPFVETNAISINESTDYGVVIPVQFQTGNLERVKLNLKRGTPTWNTFRLYVIRKISNKWFCVGLVGEKAGVDIPASSGVNEVLFEEIIPVSCLKDDYLYLEMFGGSGARSLDIRIEESGKNKTNLIAYGLGVINTEVYEDIELTDGDGICTVEYSGNFVDYYDYNSNVFIKYIKISEKKVDVNLIAEYLFNGNLLDETGNHNATGNDLTLIQDRFMNLSAYEFNGSTSYVDCG